jgi:tellurium resistance protein TerD
VGVSLTKGGNVSLSKEAPGLTAVTVGLGWDVRTTTGTEFDLDASAIVVGADGKVLSDKHFIFFNNKTSPDGTSSTPATTSPVRARATTSRSRSTWPACPPTSTRSSSRSASTTPTRGSQSFGQVRNAFIRVINQSGAAEIARYDLTEDASTETAMVFGELYRNGADWKFRAVGQGYASVSRASPATSASTSDPSWPSTTSKRRPTRRSRAACGGSGRGGPGRRASGVGCRCRRSP